MRRGCSGSGLWRVLGLGCGLRQVGPRGGHEAKKESEKCAGQEADAGVGQETAGDAVVGVGAAVDDLHEDEGYEGGRVEEAVGGGGERIIAADGFEGDGGDAGVGEGLEDVLNRSWRGRRWKECGGEG